MANSSLDFIKSLSQPLAPNSPMISSTTANASSAIPFAASPTPLVPPEPRPASKWPVIALIGALAFGAYYMSGGFSGAGAVAPETKSSSKRRKAGAKRRRSVTRLRSSAKRRKSKSRKGRGRVTWDW